jgi:isopenicillin N synthase-like dioxygenase
MTLPVIDLSAPARTSAGADVAGQVGAACRDIGFFYVTGHGVPPDLSHQLDAASRAFFRLPLADKLEIAMERGGRAWRGYFPVGAELTSGKPDLKEGLYFGTELGPDHPRVQAGLPLHGRNLFPRQVPPLRDLVLAYLDALDGVAQTVLRLIALSLDLDAGHFASTYTANPTVLFRIFHYPPGPPGPPGSDSWGVGEHTDYGLLTLLAQDDNGGLQVRTPSGWIDAPPLPGTFVCNIGDMLEQLTDGRYRSTPHRVRNLSGRDRLSFPYFYDPDFDAPIPSGGTYGDYLVDKVSKVFPALHNSISQ